MLACEMGCRGRPFFDLNESPAEDEENDDIFHFHPQKSLPASSSLTSDLFPVPEGCQRMVNNHVFSHALSVSGIQPFVRSKDVNDSQGHSSQRANYSISNLAASSATVSYTGESKVILSVTAGATDAQAIEREEGEWSDMEGTSEDTYKKQHDGTFTDCAGTSVKPGAGEKTDSFELGRDSENISNDVGLTGSTKDEIMCGMKDENNHVSLGSEQESFEHSHNNSKHSDGNSKGPMSLDGLEESSLVLKPKDVKRFEAMHALKLANSPLKRQKVDQRKEVMLGKKCRRQTVFLNIDDVKQAGPMKTLTPRRQTFSSPVATHTMKEIHTIIPAPERTEEERQGQHVDRDQKQANKLIMERSTSIEFADHKSESNGCASQGSRASLVKPNNGSDSPAEVCPPPVPRQGLCKQSIERRQPKNPQISARKPVLTSQVREIFDAKAANKKHHPSKKKSANSPQCLDTSVERLLREVTSEKFWHQPGETDLQCVPGEFESVVEYVRVFEPLLFEECRAQLYSTWEDLTETVLRDAHIMVRIKTVERRERGWFDLIVLPVHECKWLFKEGDVAILSTPRPGAARFRRSNNPAATEDDAEAELAGQVAGTVRRYIPTDTRDPPGAILHFYVGHAYDLSSIDDNHVLKKFQPKSIWYLTVLGSLATTQREYIALHAFHRLNLQMQTAILKPSPGHFPKYEEQPPAMPECFTQNFVEHLHRTFNGPQLSAIQWAAMHTAAGTNSSGMTKRQDPWPFTLVQGPPGSGKTHTVWGMLNVIHLVQYQHYYTALLKKLAPESYTQANESSPEGAGSGSIDEVLQNMDQSLFRTLPKLCPKPRMLVCAPSNAATDELLARVLDRGFIDGEMKIYRPDVARVGVDSQSRAAQAVSVERRTEQLLVKGREEIIGWMHQLRVHEAQFSRQITSLQRELFAAAAAVHSQGSVSVDPDILLAQGHNRDVLLQNLAAVVEGRDKVLVEISRLLILESRFRPGCNFNLEEARAKLEASFANEAEIVFTTVSSSGRKLFSRLTHGFDMVVIDEAAQASEVAVLPPLSLGAARCVLVGDPQQLPATVISKAAGTLLYSRSLFERFQQAGCPTMLLSVQYRMHPQIRDFPSRYFYQGQLSDSECVSNLADELYYRDPLLRPYIFYDLTHGRESHWGGSVSYQNIHEARFSRWLYDHLQKTLKSLGGIKVSVGIITPYKLQLKCLQREFKEVLDSEEGKDLYINTVDAFQGQERDVIIMSCVRASNHGVGFVADIRRMNVALTRARRALWVVGNAGALVQSDDWAALIVDAKARNCFRDMDSIPKDLVPKGPVSYTPLPGKASSSYMRGMRMNGPWHGTLDLIPGSKFGGQSVQEEGPYFWAPPKNGSYERISKARVENLEQSGSKRQNSAGTCKRHS